MRHISRYTRVAVGIAALALTATACGETSGESAQKEEKGGGSSASSTGYQGKGIGLAYDVGGRGDQSFNDSAYSGYEKARAEFKIGGQDLEPTDGESDADKVARLTQLATKGYNPIVGVGFAYAPAVKEVAPKFPKTTFAIIDDDTVKAGNVADLVFHEEQGSYLAGVAAAKVTKAKHVGFIGGVDVALIHKFYAGFKAGVASVDPKIKVEKQYLTEKAEDGGFSSPNLGKEAAKGQLDKGADVLYAAAGLSGQGVIEAAATAKVWAIGVDSDQYKQKPLAKYKDHILTSALKDVGGAVYDLSKSVVDGKPVTGETRFDLASGRVGLSTANPKYTAMTDVVAAVKKAEAGIKDGSITVPSS
ncbi:BMP family ABC transporter substrate-binding protein [Streptomyces sp. NPDC049954]|uniref:BMP family lipoprotein n=1 Tax=Streptomyces sp. NPDC049954 TaxID=3155779 RepID=UPI00342CBDBE